MWLRNRFVFAPDGGGGGGGGGDGGGNQNQPAQRPDYIPEKYWDAAKGQANIEELGKGYSSLTSLLGKKAGEITSDEFKILVDQRVATMRPELEKEIATKALGVRPEKADGYKLELDAKTLAELPEEFRDINAILKDDPLVAIWRDIAHSSGFGQEKFAAGVAGFLKTIAQSNDAGRKAEIGKLGENGQGRVDAVNRFFDAKLGAGSAEANALKSLPLSAPVIIAMEKLMTAAGDPSVLGGGASAAASREGAKAEIARLTADKEFAASLLNNQHPQHKANMAKLTELHAKAA